MSVLKIKKKDSLTVIKEALEKLKDKVEKWEKENEPNNH